MCEWGVEHRPAWLALHVVRLIANSAVNCNAPVTRDRLFGWHAELFPTGYSGLDRINVGAWRDDATGPMQVVAGPLGRQRVHFEAPPADRLESEIDRDVISR